MSRLINKNRHLSEQVCSESEPPPTSLQSIQSIMNTVSPLHYSIKPPTVFMPRFSIHLTFSPDKYCAEVLHVTAMHTHAARNTAGDMMLPCLTTLSCLALQYNPHRRQSVKVPGAQHSDVHPSPLPKQHCPACSRLTQSQSGALPTYLQSCPS
ncbi:hypothetical protein E2C01_080796 [Portunus trituberculatus]|uniref:Uncharacterized protein n=1 Tax=Portunus trituberculatus TaxID=210409 RepID=A0A5B7IX14_PORTR|nr:hypothetical protein [Portunus trituberculatus]